MQAPQGSLNSSWLVAMAKRNLLLPRSLEDGGSLLGTYAFCLDPIGAQVVAPICVPLQISRASDSRLSESAVAEFEC